MLLGFSFGIPAVRVLTDGVLGEVRDDVIQPLRCAGEVHAGKLRRVVDEEAFGAEQRRADGILIVSHNSSWSWCHGWGREKKRSPRARPVTMAMEGVLLSEASDLLAEASDPLAIASDP